MRLAFYLKLSPLTICAPQLLRRYLLAKRTLAAGDDRRAEVLFLEALDAEPVTYGACAALLSILRQVRVHLLARMLDRALAANIFHTPELPLILQFS